MEQAPQPIPSPLNDVSYLATKHITRTKPYDLSTSIASSNYSPIVKSLSKTSSDDLSKYSYSSMCIRKTAIDWRLVKKEAEAIKLRTENQRLQALIRANNEELEKCKIEHKKQLDENNLKALSMQSRASSLEEQINELKNNLSILNIDKAQSEKSLRDEIEFTEKRLTECQVNDVKLRSKIVDLEEEVKRTVLKNEQNNAELQHQLITLRNDLESANREKQLYLITVAEYRDKIQLVTSLENKINELEIQNRELEKTISDLKDGKSMSFILDNELRELAKLRIENGELLDENKKLKEMIKNSEAPSQSDERPHKIARGRSEVTVEEITDNRSARSLPNDSLVQVEFDDEVSVSESMNNSELEIEPVEDDMEPSTSYDKGRPPQRRGINDDQEESLGSSSGDSSAQQDLREEEEGEEDDEDVDEVDGDHDEQEADTTVDTSVPSERTPQRHLLQGKPMRMTLAGPKHSDHASSDELSNQSESEEGEDDSEGSSCSGSDDSDIQEIED